MTAVPVKYEQEGGIVILTLNEPDTRNALSPEINDALVEYSAKINKDYSVGCVILTGAGEGFSSGGNVKRMQDRSTAAVQKPPVDVRRYYTEGIQRVPVALYNLEAPIIAAVNGAAIGAGLDLAT
ncbi:MAG: putative enoyl-CoA hydratase, partial [Pseudomonadota bacterium]